MLSTVYMRSPGAVHHCGLDSEEPQGLSSQCFLSLPSPLQQEQLCFTFEGSEFKKTKVLFCKEFEHH